MTFDPVGCYEGVLQCDMIDAVLKFKRPVIDVLYPDLFSADKPYPLTYVPMPLMCLPLRKGRKVVARFTDGSAMYPVLYKLADEDYDSEFIAEDKKIALPTSGELVKWPEAQCTLSVVKLSEKSWVITTTASADDSDADGYTILHRGGQTVLLGDDKYLVASDNVGILASAGISFEVTGGGMTGRVKGDVSVTSTDGAVALTAKNGVNVTSTDAVMEVHGKSGAVLDGQDGKVKILNGSKNLAQVLQNFIQVLLQNSTPGTPCTIGSPASHGWSPQMLQGIQTLKADLSALME